MTKLHQLAVGSRFMVNGSPDRTGEIIRHSPCSSLVLWDKATEVTVAGKTFLKRERVHIAPNTEVTAL